MSRLSVVVMGYRNSSTILDALDSILHQLQADDEVVVVTSGGDDTATVLGRDRPGVTVIDSWQLHFWILSQSPAITVTHPKALRSAIASKLREALHHYDDNA